MKKLNVHIPFNLEVVWAVAKLKGKPQDIKQIFLCSFYSPPKSGKNLNLINHISDEIHKFLANDPQAGLIVSGDINHLDLKALLSIEPSLKQIVPFPTRKDSLLDVIVTNLHKFYCVPQKLPPLLPDDPACAEPSDHNGVIVNPLPVSKQSSKRVRIQKKIRPFPKAKINLFGQIIGSENWSFLSPELKPGQLVELFQFYNSSMTDLIFPEKTISVYSDDKPYFNEQLRLIKRQRCREYTKHGHWS